MNKKKKIITTIIVLLIIVLVGIFTATFSFKIYGRKTIKLEYNNQYIEEGYSLKILGKDYTKKVVVSNNIDITKVGTYKVKYTYKLGFINLTKERKINIVDNEFPIITLNGDLNKNICKNSSYIEEGYSATDNYDGDITAKVKVENKDGYILYSVKDSSGNETKIERKINELDNEKPTITLLGNTLTYITHNEEYKESGFKAKDNCDGDITSKVNVKGNVDTTKIGNYTVTYSVKDSSGNETKIERTIIVEEKQKNVKPGVIYLTFDDGPSASGSTEAILNILKEEGIKATFFVTGKGPDSLIKRAYEEGHKIALHSYTHDYSYIYKNVNNYFADLDKLQKRVERITGQKSYLVRFPGGTSNTVSKKYSIGIMTKLVLETKKRGYKVFDWNIDGSDAYNCAKSNVKNKKQCVYNNVVTKLSKKRSNIVLLHDVKSYTPDALKDIIKFGKSNGYTFQALSDDYGSYISRISN